jgi:hypothetical protein
MNQSEYNQQSEREMWDAAVPRPASTTPVLTARYRRVIVNLYAKVCEACGTPVAVKAGYSAQGADGWRTFCTACAEQPNFTAFAARMLTVARDQGAPATAVEAIAPVLRDLIAAKDNADHGLAQFDPAYAALLDLRLSAVREGLCDDPLYQGLTLALTYCQGRFREAAESILRQWESKGSISPGQVKFGNAIAADANKRAEAAAPLPDVPPALYINDAGEVRRIYRIGSSRLGCRRFNGTTFQAEGSTGLRSVADGLANGTTRMLSGAEATAFGRQHGRCFNCLAIGRPGVLTEDRSLAVGYGPDCADNHGWYYPTAAEADAILRPKA